MRNYIAIMAVFVSCAFTYKAGVIQTSRRVDSVLLHQSKLKDRDNTYWLLAKEFPEDVE